MSGAADPGVMLLAFPDDQVGGAFPWLSSAEITLGGLIDYVAADPDWWMGDGAARFAGLAEDAGELICAGMGAGALDALLAGRFLGAQSILAIGPAAPEARHERRWDDLAALFADASLGFPGQSLDIIVPDDASEADLAFCERLHGFGGGMRLTHAGLPAAALLLALRQSGWVSDWVAAFAAGGPARGPDLARAWRRAFDFEVDLDLDAATFQPEGRVRLTAHLRNRGARALDLGAAAREHLQLGARTRNGAGSDAGAELYAALPDRHLAPGERASVQVSIPSARLSEPGTTVSVGLVRQGGFWLSEFGFPEAVLQAEPQAESQQPAGPRPSDARGSAAPRSDATPPPAITADTRFKAEPMDPSATRADVVECYRVLLGREPESEAAIAAHLTDKPDTWTLIRRMMRAPEASRWLFYEAGGRLAMDEGGGGPLQTQASPDEVQRLTQHVEATWTRFGREQPYFSALANPDYAADRLSAKGLEAFYATGDEEVAAFRSACARNAVALQAPGSVLEFGCRVGRLGEALARAFGDYTGVDISTDQLAIADARLRSRGLNDARLITIQTFLTDEARFDVFVSVLALQHFPPPLMLDWLEQGLRRLKPGGVAYFQLPCHLYDYSFETSRYLDGRARNGPSELHALPQHEVFQLFDRHGLTAIEVLLSPRIGPRGLSYAFLARKEADEHAAASGQAAT